MTVEQLISTIRTDWAEYLAAIREVGDDRLEETGVVGEWSTKDIVAHVTWFEKEIVGVIEQRALVGSEWWQLHHDERNRLIYEANKDRDLADVLAEATSAHERLMTAVVTLDDAALGNASAFTDMPSDWLPSDIVAQNTYEHYRDHTNEIRAWLAV